MIKTKGFKELDAFLAAFPAKLQKNAVRSALTAAARPVRDEARARAERKTGKLRKAIKTSNPKVNADGTVSVRVKLQGEHSYLGWFQEYGVAPHFIRAGDSGKSPRLLNKAAKRGDVLGDVATGHLKIGDNFISGEVFHPGRAARPFLRPALDVRAKDAVQAFGGRLASYLKDKTGFSAPAVLEIDE